MFRKTLTLEGYGAPPNAGAAVEERRFSAA